MSEQETWDEMGKAGYTDKQKVMTMKTINEFLRIMKKDPHIYDKGVDKGLEKYR